jgi:hypothetical protein
MPKAKVLADFTCAIDAGNVVSPTVGCMGFGNGQPLAGGETGHASFGNG